MQVIEIQCLKFKSMKCISSDFEFHILTYILLFHLDILNIFNIIIYFAYQVTPFYYVQDSLIVFSFHPLFD